MSSPLRLTLGFLVLGITSLLSSNHLPRVHTAGQKQDRVLKERPWGNEAIKITKVKAKGSDISLGRKYSAEDDWLRGLVVTIKNVSPKNVVFVELELHFLHSEHAEDEPVTGFPIWAGTPPTQIRTTSKTLPPGESWDISLADEEYNNLKELLDKTGYPASIKNVEIITTEVIFSDNTKWIPGESLPRENGAVKKEDSRNRSRVRER